MEMGRVENQRRGMGGEQVAALMGGKRRSWRHFSSWSSACCATMSSVPRDGGGKGAEKSRDISTALYPLRLRCGASEGQWNRIGFKVLAKLVQSSLCSQVKVDSTFQPGYWGYLVCTGIV